MAVKTSSDLTIEEVDALLKSLKKPYDEFDLNLLLDMRLRLMAEQATKEKSSVGVI